MAFGGRALRDWSPWTDSIPPRVSVLLEENHVRLATDGITMSPIVCRLITPGEMDLMARIAGLQIIERFANWRREPFTADSRAHVSIYRTR